MQKYCLQKNVVVIEMIDRQSEKKIVRTGGEREKK
jgi:hypothetical protein